MLESFTIDDNLALQESAGIEVTLQLSDGSRRWCVFMRPETLAACGDWLDGTTTRIHYGAAHLIIVAVELNQEVIERALRHIDCRGELSLCSLPLA